MEVAEYKYKCQGIGFFFWPEFQHVSNEQRCLKTTRLYEDLLSSLFHFFYFIFSAPISFSLCFPVSPSLLFVDVHFSNLYQV